jgi:hypothetical protein
MYSVKAKHVGLDVGLKISLDLGPPDRVAVGLGQPFAESVKVVVAELADFCVALDSLAHRGLKGGDEV